MSAFGWNNSYEHKTQIYDTNYANYGGYWSSNLPRAYKDPQIFDKGNVDVFGVGSAKTSSIQTYKMYYAVMTLNTQNSVNPTVRIKGRIGVMIPPWCGPCTFFGSHTKAMSTFTAPSGNVSWTY